MLKNLNKNDIEIVSGTCKGADKLGEKYSSEYNLKLKYFPANWDKLGRGAGFIRNKQMAEYSTHLVAFWDYTSKGTKHMIDLAKKYQLNIRIVDIRC